MPPRRIRAPPQQSAAAKVFKIFLLLALALGFKMLVAAGIRAYNLHPGQQQAQDLAAAGQAAGVSASSGDAAEPVLTGEKSAAAGSDSSAAAQDDGAIADEYLGTETPAQMVDRLIRANRVMVFSKSYCPYSKRGKAAMRHHLGDEIGVLELDQLEGRADMAELQDELQRLTGGRTVPRIFLDGRFIGGADDVAALDASGELERMLREAGLLGGAAAE